MANKYSVTRTNYFAVRDEKRFREIIAGLSTDGKKIHVFDALKDKERLFCFGLYGSISYDGKTSLKDLCSVVADGHAIILFEAAHENLSYVTGIATIITKDGVTDIDLIKTAVKTARDLLGDASYSPQCDY